jgi:hypothetical protein
MRALVALSTCHLYETNHINQAVRDTWLRETATVGLDYRFFVGRGDTSFPEDVVQLDVDDSYNGLSHKTIASHLWALNQGYDYVFQCCPDCYARPERLMASGFEKSSYSGYPFCNLGGPSLYDHDYPQHFCSGGAGYWMDRQACVVLTYDRPILDCAEDRWVGNIMRQAEIPLTPDGRYNYTSTPSPRKDNDVITCHLSESTGVYDWQKMYDTHSEWLKSLEE